MKLKMKKDLLMDTLNSVSKALSSKNIIPILSGIKFDVTKEHLILTASDNDITIQSKVEKSDDLDIIKTGSIVIKGKYILDIVRKLEDDFINLEMVDDSKVLIYTADNEFNLNGIDAKEYPTVDLALTEDFVSIKMKTFKNMINGTNYAASIDEARAILTGVNIKVTKNVLECSATDSYRLALKKSMLDTEIKKDIDIIVPSKNLSELLKILPSEDDEMMDIHIFSNKIIFKFRDLLFQSRLINGTYPNTKNLIPEETIFDLRLNKNEFFKMVDRASVLNNDRDTNVVTLDIENNVLKMTSMSLEVGKVEAKMAIICDDKIRISFSSRYMMEALRTISSEDVILSFVGEIKPILIKEEDNNQDSINLILPIRTY